MPHPAGHTTADADQQICTARERFAGNERVKMHICSLSTQRTPFPTTATKPGASICPSFLTGYEHHWPLSDSWFQSQILLAHTSSTAALPCPVTTRGSHMAVTFLLPFRNTSPWLSRGCHLPSPLPEHPLQPHGLGVSLMSSKAGVVCPGNNACSRGQDS